MDKETLNKVKKLDSIIRDCNQALSRKIIGVYSLSDRAFINSEMPLPEDLCREITDVITKYKIKKEQELDML